MLAQLSREELRMRIYVGLLAVLSILSTCLSAAVFEGAVKGTVLDPSGAPVAGAQVSIMSRLGVEAQTVTSAAGTFELETGGIADAHLVITARASAPRRCPWMPPFP